jgi:hypothetical protein
MKSRILPFCLILFSGATARADCLDKAWLPMLTTQQDGTLPEELEIELVSDGCSITIVLEGGDERLEVTGRESECGGS